MSNQDIEIELSLLKALSNRENFNKYYDSIDKSRLLHSTAMLLNDYEKYFNSVENENINFTEFMTLFSQNWHAKDLDEYEISYYKDKAIPAIINCKKDTADSAISALIDRKLRNKLNEIITGHINDVEISEALEDYKKEKSKFDRDEDDGYTADKVDFSCFDDSEGVEWFIPSLQNENGNLRKGQFAVIYSYSNVGKGAAAVTQACKALQNGKNVIYFTSEDTIQDLHARVYSNIYHKKIPGGFKTVFDNIEKVRDKFFKDYSDQFRAYELEFGDLHRIRSRVEKYQPDLLIVDMTDALCTSEESINQIKRVYDSLRKISNKFCPVFATSQAKNTAYFCQEDQKMKNKKWLSMGDCYGSQVGKQGASTTMVGIAQDYANDYRYIHTPKNKGHNIIKATCELIEKFSLYEEL